MVVVIDTSNFLFLMEVIILVAYADGFYICIYQVGTGITNGLINARKAVDKSFAVEAEEDIPILSTSVAYGVYMAVSSNLRYVYISLFFL